MLRLFKKIIALTVLFGICAPSYALTIDLILIEQKNKYIGDYNQLMGVEKAIIDAFKKKDISVVTHEYPADNYMEQLEKDFPEGTTSPNKKIALSVNDYGIEALRDLKKRYEGNIITVHLNHQQMDSHKNLFKSNENKTGADFIVLPTHVVDDKLRDLLKKSTTKLIETVGVCHNVQPDDLATDFKRIQKDIPGSDNKETKYLVVVLGGDTQNPDGTTWRYYPEAEAKKLAVYAAKIAREKGYILLITNGPRTGKFDPTTGVERKSHKDGILDPVSSVFLKSLSDAGLDKRTYKIFDFQFGKPSAWKGLLGSLTCHPGSVLLLGGESTSMVSEALSNVPKEIDVTIFANSSMSDIHHQYMKSEYEAGHVSTLSKDMQFKPRKENVNQGKALSAAQVVADELVAMVVKGI